MLLHIENNDKTTSFAHNRDTATFGQFKDQLSQVSNIPRDIITVKLGAPPTVVDYPDDTLLIHTPFYGGSNVVVAARTESAPHHLHQPMPSEPGYMPYHPNSHRSHQPMLASTYDAPHHQNSHQWPTQMLPPVDDSPRYYSNAASDDVGDAWAEFKDGYLVRRTVPSDNSCLFTSL
ncbi:hypothetical protein LPJ81_006469, partial [Coemansia sp. IMI 209127]